MDRMPWEEQRRALMVLAHRDFNDDEYVDCRRVLEEAGMEIELCSTRTGWVTGTFGARVPVESLIQDVRPRDFAAVVFMGGDGARELALNVDALRLADLADKAGCVVGAICAAPMILAAAGLLSMRRATCHPSCVGDLTSFSAVLVDQPVVVADWTVTASGPSAARDFALTVVRLVAARRGV